MLVNVTIQVEVPALAPTAVDNGNPLVGTAIVYVERLLAERPPIDNPRKIGKRHVVDAKVVKS